VHLDYKSEKSVNETGDSRRYILKELILHIGTSKTGTSAIQSYCTKNREKLKEFGYEYPRMGFRFKGVSSNRNGHFLCCRIMDENGKRRFDEELAVRSEGYKKLKESFQNSDKVILSDEHIWNACELKKEGLLQVKRRMDEQNIAVKIIVYFRRQDEWMQSAWGQKVKGGLCKSFSEFMSGTICKDYNLNYGKRLQDFIDVFGRENVIVRPYERCQFADKKSVVADFLSQLNLPLEQMPEEVARVINPSLEGVYIEAKRYLNQFSEFHNRRGWLMRWLLQLQEEDALEGKKWSFYAPGERSKFFQQFKASNDALAKEFKINEENTLFLNPVDESTYEFVGNDTAKIVEICGRIILKQKQDIKDLEKDISTINKMSPARWSYHYVKRKWNATVRK